MQTFEVLMLSAEKASLVGRLRENVRGDSSKKVAPFELKHIAMENK